MGSDLVLLGGGHANLPLIQQIPDIVREGHTVTCISLRPVHYYSGMGPGMLGGSYSPEQIRFPIEHMVEEAGGRFMEAHATNIDTAARCVTLESGEEVPYDVLSLNTGSSVAPTVAVRGSAGEKGAPRVFTVKPIEQLLALREAVAAEIRSRPLLIVVVGGGPAAVETAANLARLVRESAAPHTAGASAVTLLAGRDVLPGFPRRAKQLTLRALKEVGVLARPEARVSRIQTDGLVVDGKTEAADIVVLATGVVPSGLFEASGMPTGEDGSLAVNENLHMLGDRFVFGGGDCIWFTQQPLPRAGVFAVREGPVLVHNVRETLNHGGRAHLKRFSPGGGYLLLLNFGDDTALFWRQILGVHLVYRSAGAYRLKDRIDMAFMHQFGSESDRHGGGVE